MAQVYQPAYKRTLGSMIFLSRWLQAPLYFGLIVAQLIYVYRFMLELWHLLHKVIDTGNPISETDVMLAVLGLIDVVMIANLLIMVIVGGYETFVSRLNLGNHPDQPEWLSHVNAGMLKVKLATALIGISSIHLLQSFINAKSYFSETTTKTFNSDGSLLTEVVNRPLDHGGEILLWQVMIHLTFVVSAVILAYIDRLGQTAHKTPAH